jgi:hypothetical protein
VTITFDAVVEDIGLDNQEPFGSKSGLRASFLAAVPQYVREIVTGKRDFNGLRLDVRRGVLRRRLHFN